MAQASMTVRLDNNIKTQFDSLCEQFGMSSNAAINVFINTVVRTQAIPFKISAKDDSARQGLLDLLFADRSNRPDLTLDEINEEIRKARQERRKREEREAA